MGPECRWRHARKRWSWEFEDFEKESVEIGPLKQTVEIGPLRQELASSAVEACGQVLQISTDRDLKHLEIYHHTLGMGSDSMVSIVWLANTFKNCVSLLVSLWTEVKKLIIRSYLKRKSLLVYLYMHCITVVIGIFMGIQHRAKVMNWSLGVNEFEFQSCYHVSFPTNSFSIITKPPHLHMG